MREFWEDLRDVARVAALMALLMLPGCGPALVAGGVLLVVGLLIKHC